jgi:hypothetical protein
MDYVDPDFVIMAEYLRFSLRVLLVFAGGVIALWSLDKWFRKR